MALQDFSKVNDYITMLGTGNALATRCYNTCFTLHGKESVLLVDADSKGNQVELTTTVSYSQSGTYFPTLKVSSERKDDSSRIYTYAQNLDRIRIVVE
jgi:hypothetical protein